MSVIVGENNYYYNYSTSMIWEDVSIWYWAYYIHRLSTWLYFFDQDNMRNYMNFLHCNWMTKLIS